MASVPPSSFASASRSDLAPRASTPQASKASLVRPRKSTLEFGTPIKLESSSPYRTPTSSSKASAFLSKTPFGTPNKINPPLPSTTSMNSQSSSASTQPRKPLTGRAQWTARIRSLWIGGDTSTSMLQAKGYLPYSGLAKLMLQTNIDRLYFFSYIAIHLFLCISLISPLHPISSLLLPFRPLIFLLSLSTFSLSVLPLIFLRRSELTSTELQSKSTNNSTQQDITIMGISLRYGSPALYYYGILSKARMGMLIGLYSLSGFFLAVFQGVGLFLYSSDGSAWSPYQTVTFRNPQGLRISSLRPNERLFFLLGSNLILGAIYILYRSLLLVPSSIDTFSPHSALVFEPQATVESLGTRLSSKLRRRLPRALVVGSILPILQLALYFLIRRSLFRFTLSVIGHDSVLRPVLIPSFRHHFLSAGLIFRTTTLGIFSTATWETFNILWEILSTQPFTELSGGLSRYSREPTKCLIEGLQSRRIASVKETDIGLLERQYFAHFAFAEIAILSATDYERRKAIFREVGSINGNIIEGGNKSAWVLIAQECVKVIQEERLCLSTRGKERNNPTTPTATTSTLRDSHLRAADSSHKAIVESGSSVLKKRPESIWDRLASSSAAPTASISTTTNSSNQTSTQANSSSNNDLGAIMHRLAPPPAVQSQVVKASSSTNPLAKNSIAVKPGTSTAATLTLLFLGQIGSLFKTIYILLPPDFRHVLSNLYLVKKFRLSYKRLLEPSSQTLLYTGRIPQETALTTWSIQTLSALLSASMDQDEYGTVALSSNHKLGVDDVLEEIALLLLSLSQLGQEVAKEIEGEAEIVKKDLAILWDRRVAPIVIASRTAITLVLGVFEPTGFQLRQSTRDKVDKAMVVGQ